MMHTPSSSSRTSTSLKGNTTMLDDDKPSVRGPDGIKVTLEIWHDYGKRFPPIPFIDFADAEKWALGAKNSGHVGDGWNITIKRETQVTFS